MGGVLPRLIDFSCFIANNNSELRQHDGRTSVGMHQLSIEEHFFVQLLVDANHSIVPQFIQC